MKGVVLAGGNGTRLLPLTKVTNKHLLPVYDKPMIHFPIGTLLECGIRRILIITGSEHMGDFMSLLGSGKEFGAEFTYRAQEGAGGIAEALSLAEEFVGKEKFAVILGDNVFTGNFSDQAKRFEGAAAKAKIFLKQVAQPGRFGVAKVANNRVVSIIEKPKEPESDLAVTGFYLYDGNTVFDIIKRLTPSARNELEITDVNSEYLRRGELDYSILDGEWSDAGTIESLYHAAGIVRKRQVGK